MGKVTAWRHRVAKSERTGTLLCWLFGHKFLFIRETELHDANWTTRREWLQTDFCVRCGKPREMGHGEE